MSSAGIAVVLPQSYFCHQCNRTVTLTPPPNSDLSCPNCSGGFLEEFDSNPMAASPILPDPFSLFTDPFLSPSFTTVSRGPIIFSSTTIDLQNPRNVSPSIPSASPSPSLSSSSDFNPFDFFQNYLQNLRDNGTDFQFVVEGNPGDSNFRLPPNIGDYLLGPGLEQLIQHLAENDPNRYGTPPASKRAIDGLSDVVITPEIVNSDSNSCAVCMNEFEINLKAKQMPCKHLYHSDCLIPWLQLHNSCPVCRYELPTDDPDYENRGAASGQGGSSEGSPGNGNGGSQGGGRGGERSFRISLPWPFSALRSSGVNNDGNNSGSSSGPQQGGSDGSGV